MTFVSRFSAITPEGTDSSLGVFVALLLSLAEAAFTCILSANAVPQVVRPNAAQAATSLFCREIEGLWVWRVTKQLWFRRRHSGCRFDGLAVQIGCPDAPSIRCFRQHANALRLTRDSYRYLQTCHSFCQV